MALINYHISFNPLHVEEDATHYHCYKKHNYIIGDNIA